SWDRCPTAGSLSAERAFRRTRIRRSTHGPLGGQSVSGSGAFTRIGRRLPRCFDAVLACCTSVEQGLRGALAVADFGRHLLYSAGFVRTSMIEPGRGAAYAVLFSEIGISLLVTTLIGVLVGRWVDAQLG